METRTEHGGIDASGGGRRGTEEVREKASRLTATARERTMATIDERKGELCELLDHTAESLEEDRLGRHAAEYARRGAGYLRRRSADELLAIAREELRARPGLLLSACFVAGLAVARVLRGGAGASAGREAWDDDRGSSRWPEERSRVEPAEAEDRWGGPARWREGEP